MNIADRNIMGEPNYPKKQGLLKTVATSRCVLWSVENYRSLLTSKKSMCSDTFRVPMLSNCLFYLCLSLCEDLLSLNVIKTVNNPFLSNNTRKPIIKVVVTITDILNQIELTKEFVMLNNNVTPPINIEVSCNLSQKFAYEACLEVQCTVINTETEHFQLFKRVHECQELSKDYVPTISTKELKQHLQVMLDGEVHNHVTIYVGEESFQVHKTILCSHSVVFAAMFEHDTLERAKNRIYIDDISAETFGEMISYIYFGSTSKLFSNMAIDLYAAADKYAMVDLRRKCSNFLINNLTKELVLNILILADRHADEELKSLTIQFLVNKAADIIDTDEFLVFLETESELARSILLHLVKIVAK